MSEARKEAVEEAFEVLPPQHCNVPVVVSSPHSGQVVPLELLRQSGLTVEQLRRSEDRYVDELFATCCEFGMPLLKARFTRTFVDLNRDATEIDPTMFDGELPQSMWSPSPRVTSGLGVIPRVVSDSEAIYRCKLSQTEIQRRLKQVYEPFHKKLNALLDTAFDHTGCAILLDCHSMPNSSVAGTRRWRGKSVDVVLGDRFGTSAAPEIVDYWEKALLSCGLTVARNHPYPGGHITQRQGRPAQNRHALQIELNRSMYMDELQLQKSANFEAVRNIMCTALEGFAGYILDDFGSTPARKAAAE